MDSYELLDSGNGRKLERFGPYTLARPCAQAVWRPLSPIRLGKVLMGLFLEKVERNGNVHGPSRHRGLCQSTA